MRVLALTLLIAVASPSLTVAQTVPTVAPSTYPEPGTFCGFLTMCTHTAQPKTES